MKTTSKLNVRRLVTIAMFCALSYVVTLIFHFKVGFLTFDVKDAVTCVAAMLFGPGAGVSIAFLVATIESLSISDTLFWGWLMNFASTAIFSLTASLVYRRHKKMWSAVVGLGVAVFATTAGMLLLNIVVTPIYMKAPRADVLAMIPKTLFPFNLLKSTLNASLVMIFYKPISTALKRAGVLADSKQGEGEYRLFSRKSLTLLLSALLLAVACVVIMMLLMGGEFVFELLNKNVT